MFPSQQTTEHRLPMPEFTLPNAQSQPADNQSAAAPLELNSIRILPLWKYPGSEPQ